jgi:hypothetical protein
LTQVLQSIEQALRAAGFRERGAGLFDTPHTPRIVALVEANVAPEEWPGKVETVLRNEAFRIAPSWSRYVVLALNSPKTSELAAAAAAFSRDVSKCRRLVAFAGETGGVLPFLPLPSTPGGGGTPGHDLEDVARRILPSPQLATAFLDDHTATTHVETLAEDVED